MRNLIVLFLLLSVGCYQSSDTKFQALQDTLKKLKRNTDFRPLKINDAYKFINQYYLPQLDTKPTGRKIFEYSLLGKDFQYIYKKKALEAEYRGDSIWIKANLNLPPLPPGATFNGNLKWDNKKLSNTVVVSDSSYWYPNMKHRRREISSVEAWSKKYGYGFMCISYPVYNIHTKRILIREWIENADWCGTGRERAIWYKRVPDGWKVSK